MSGRTYRLERVTDLLTVPSELRERCVKELLIVLELAELAGASPGVRFDWVDDGKAEYSLNDPANGETWLTMKVSGEEPA